MKEKQLITCALFSLVATASGFATESGDVAWQKSGMEECKKERKECTGSASACQKEMDACKKDAVKSDEASFAYALSPVYKTKFKSFTPEQKKKAMDLADKNKMSPDSAVESVLDSMNKNKK